MGLFNKILSKNKGIEDTVSIDSPKDTFVAEESITAIADVPLAPVEFDYEVTVPMAHSAKTPKIKKEVKAQVATKDPEKKPSALQLSTKKLLKLQNELKNLTVMQVEKQDGDIIPEGIITGKFDIERALDSKRWFFNLLTNGGSVIGASRPYSSVTAVMNGISSVISNAYKASVEDQTLKRAEILPFPKWVIYLDNNEKFNFILYASNGNPVIHSHGYSSKQGCKKGIEGIIAACKNPMIEKTYLHHK